MLNNPFENPAFSMTSLTAALNLLPSRYGRLEELRLFPAKPVRTRTVVVEERAGVLNLLPSLPPGARRPGLRAPMSLWYHPLPAGGGVAQLVRAAES